MSAYVVGGGWYGLEGVVFPKPCAVTHRVPGLSTALSTAPPRSPSEAPAHQDLPVRLFVALFDYDPVSMSPNPDAAEEELPFREGQILKVGLSHAPRPPKPSLAYVFLFSLAWHHKGQCVTLPGGPHSCLLAGEMEITRMSLLPDGLWAVQEVCERPALQCCCCCFHGPAAPRFRGFRLGLGAAGLQAVTAAAIESHLP